MLLKIPLFNEQLVISEFQKLSFSQGVYVQTLSCQNGFIYAQPRFETEAWSNSDKWTIQRDLMSSS